MKGGGLPDRKHTERPCDENDNGSRSSYGVSRDHWEWVGSCYVPVMFDILAVTSWVGIQRNTRLFDNSGSKIRCLDFIVHPFLGHLFLHIEDTGYRVRYPKTGYGVDVYAGHYMVSS